MISPRLLRCARLPCSPYCPSTPPRANLRAPCIHGLLTSLASTPCEISGLGKFDELSHSSPNISAAGRSLSEQTSVHGRKRTEGRLAGVRFRGPQSPEMEHWGLRGGATKPESCRCQRRPAAWDNLDHTPFSPTLQSGFPYSAHCIQQTGAELTCLGSLGIVDRRNKVARTRYAGRPRDSGGVESPGHDANGLFTLMGGASSPF